MDEIESINWAHPIFIITVILLGCCVGSYLNAVIYRLPRGMSTSEPKRSFCPVCKAPIPYYRNIPIVTWVIQRGRCAECNCKIAVRYVLVEALTGLVWLGCWWFFAIYKWETILPPTIWYPGALALFFIILSTLAIVITFIDIEHLLIPLQLTISAAIIAVLGAVVLPWHWGAEGWIGGLQESLLGGASAFFALWAVVLLGKVLFGRRKLVTDECVKWSVRDADESSEDPNENVSLVIDGEDHFWHDIFYRSSDRLKMTGVSELQINSENIEVSELSMAEEVLYVGDREFALEEVKSISGKATSMVIPREAMGMGDVHLLGVIGLVLGVKSLLLVILAACVIGIFIHLFARAGFGKQMPFGPSLILGAVVWLIAGPQLVEWYMGFIREALIVN